MVAHHIVPAFDSRAGLAPRLLRECNVHPTSPDNGVYLPDTALEAHVSAKRVTKYQRRLPHSLTFGDPDAVGAWAGWAREQVQAWEDASSGHALLDELVPWWRDVARAADLPTAELTGSADGPLRLGRDAQGAPRVLESGVGRPVATTSPDGDEPVAVVAVSLGAVRWEVGVCDADGVLVAWHRVVRINDRAVAWASGTADGVVRTVQLDDADTTVVAVWRGPTSSSEPAPSGRSSVDALVRLADGSAELVDGRRPTIGSCERRVLELEDTGPTTDDGRDGADDDDAWSVVPYDGDGEPLVAPWLVAVREAREVADGDLTPAAEGLIDAWASGTMHEPVADPAVVVVRCGPSSWDPTWFAQQETTLDELVRRRRLRGPVVEYGEELVAAVPWEVATDDGGAPWPRIVELLREAPVEFDSEAEERACAAEDVAARAQLEELVGEVNRLLEQRGTDQVVVLVDDDRRPAGNIDRWWPVEVRSALRRTLA